MTRRTIEQYNFDKLEFDEQILTKHFSPLASRDILFVVVHHMTIVGKGTGSALDACYKTWQTREASAHYGVDGKFIRQFVWDKDFAWATASNYGNLHGLSNEHANSSADPKWEVGDDTWHTGAKLAAYQHKVYKLGRPTSTGFGTGGTLRTHESFYATACPGPFFKSIWAAYLAEVQKQYDLAMNVKPPVVTPEPTAKTYKVVGGDTLWAIASKFKTTVPDLAKWNKIAQPYIIKPGDILFVANPGSIVTPTPPTPPPAAKSTISIMSQNLWGYGGADSSRTQAKRLPIFLKQVDHYGPEVIAVQECSNQSADRIVHEGGKTAYTPLEYCDKKLGDRGYVRSPGVGSDGRYIFYKKSVISSHWGKTILLTPEYEGDDKQSALEFLTKSGIQFCVNSFHTENQGTDDKYRVGQIKSMIAQTAHYNVDNWAPAKHRFYAGDANDHDNVLKLAFNPAGIVDPFSTADHPINIKYKSAGVYLKTPVGERIDFIACDKGTHCLSFEQIIHFPCSDHNGMYAVFEI